MVAGSHARPHTESPLYWEQGAAARPRADACHVVAPAGSVCVLDCRLWHCLPRNRTGSHRVMYNVRYFPAQKVPVDLLCNNGWKAEQPPFPPMPREVYSDLPDDVRWLYEHAPLPAPAPTQLTSVEAQSGEQHMHEVGALAPEYMGSYPPSEADATEWVKLAKSAAAGKPSS